jgi:hypothetical protein
MRHGGPTVHFSNVGSDLLNEERLIQGIERMTHSVPIITEANTTGPE